MSRRPSPLDNEQCRSCSKFSEFSKSTSKLKDGESSNGKPRRSDCPLDKEELGNRTWGFLHTMAAKYPEKPCESDKTAMKDFFKLFSKFYPCKHCAKDLRDELKVDPPRTDSQEDLSQWLCKLHNKINVKIGKDVFDCSKVNERWRDGWLDGSCD